MIDFIREYYVYILVGLFVLGIAVLLVFTILKKPEEKNESGLDKFLNFNKDIKVKKNHVNELAIFKKNLQNYYLYAFDENSKVIFKSNIYNSLFSLKNDFSNIKKSIMDKNYKVIQMIDGKVYLCFKKGTSSDSYGFSDFIDPSIIDEKYVKIKELFQVQTLNESVNIDLTEIPYKNKSESIDDKKKKKTKWTVEVYNNNFFLEARNKDNILIYINEAFDSKKKLLLYTSTVHLVFFFFFLSSIDSLLFLYGISVKSIFTDSFSV
ncbi:MAG: hypothetical protein K6G38_02865 [Gammaproteobacteria bacterium]|nr:hypothetical protein [Gammaproteobacteria bacterium]